MNTYLCNAAPISIFVGTQAEAKKLDKNFGEVNIPTSKEELIATINSLRASAYAEGFNNGSNAAPQTHPALSSDLGTASQQLDRMDRQHAQNAMQAAIRELQSGLKLMERKHGGEPVPALTPSQQRMIDTSLGMIQHAEGDGEFESDEVDPFA